MAIKILKSPAMEKAPLLLLLAGIALLQLVWCSGLPSCNTNYVSTVCGENGVKFFDLCWLELYNYCSYNGKCMKMSVWKVSEQFSACSLIKLLLVRYKQDNNGKLPIIGWMRMHKILH